MYKIRDTGKIRSSFVFGFTQKRFVFTVKNKNRIDVFFIFFFKKYFVKDFIFQIVELIMAKNLHHSQVEGLEESKHKISQ